MITIATLPTDYNQNVYNQNAVLGPQFGGPSTEGVLTNNSKWTVISGAIRDVGTAVAQDIYAIRSGVGAKVTGAPIKENVSGTGAGRSPTFGNELSKTFIYIALGLLGLVLFLKLRKRK